MSDSIRIMRIQRILRFIIWSIGLLIILTVALAWSLYPEKYDFFGETISHLGGIESDTGLDNTKSSLVMMVGFILVSIFTLGLSISYFILKKLRYNYVKGAFLLSMMIGGIGISLPWDHPSFMIIHSIGAAIFLLSFAAFNFVAQILRYLRKHKPKLNRKSFDFWIDFIFVWLVFLTFALHLLACLLAACQIFIIVLDLVITQKVALIVNLIAMILLDKEDM